MPTTRELLESNFNMHEQAFDGLMGKLVLADRILTQAAD